ncbi:MAG: hypothetical protein C4520_16475 [Candidatus Abyssobacteria bacterium SURF_5]|uniref:NYN domain-containing protein n=1 Tax=Abyssobacteria bacterium (strain SURF_5) TaxID=2093360 RepID=A0A3A4NDB2_ABYX5|nr:MAG: hypothetical protein C4520_16475 [Candidatus Abyssubacteria bacterium SURF_5]
MALLIDGHNLIGKMSGISLADPDDEEQLIRILAQHLQLRRQKVTVVFDRAAELYSGPRYERGDVRVIFALPPISADEIIIEMIRKDPNPKGLTVVSSDNEIRRCARSRRARTISAEEFARTLESPAPKRRPVPGYLREEVDVEEWLKYFRKRRS